MAITADDIRADYAEAKRLRLFCADLLEDTEAAVHICNGIGADWMPAAMRQLLDLLFPALVLPSRIHDVGYARGGTEADRHTADMLFHMNSIFEIEDRYAWYNPYRYVMKARAERFYEYLRAFGGRAFNYTEDEDPKTSDFQKA